MSDELKFESGDVVRLRSGGPKMTVEVVLPLRADPYERQVLECVWFLPEFLGCKLRRARFPIAVLEFAQDE